MSGSDFDNDGFDDLAIGVPSDDVGGVVDAGQVNVLRGSAGGLTAAGAQLWNQDSPGVPGTAEDIDPTLFTLPRENTRLIPFRSAGLVRVAQGGRDSLHCVA